MPIKSILELPSTIQENRRGLPTCTGESKESPSKGIAVSLFTIKNKTCEPEAPENSEAFLSETLQLQDKQDRQAKRPEAELKVWGVVYKHAVFYFLGKISCFCRNNKTYRVCTQRHIRACIVILGLWYTMKYQKNKKNTSHVYSWMNITLTYLAPN